MSCVTVTAQVRLVTASDVWSRHDVTVTAQVRLVTASDVWSRHDVTVTAQVRLVTAGDVWSRLDVVCHSDSSGASGESGCRVIPSCYPVSQ